MRRALFLAGCGLVFAGAAASAETPFHYTAPLPPAPDQARPSEPSGQTLPLSQADRLRAVIGNPENCPPGARPQVPGSDV